LFKLFKLQPWTFFLKHGVYIRIYRLEQKNSHAAKAKYFHYRVKYFSENFTGYKGVILTYFLQISAQNIHPLKSCAL